MFFTRKQVRRHYEANLRFDPDQAADHRGLLNGQGRKALEGMSFGFSNVGRAGCESIAVYNVLKILKRPRPLAEVIRDFEKGGYMRLGGYFGAAPYLGPLLRRCGAAARLVTPASLRRQAEQRSLTPGAVFLMSIWNRRFMPQEGLHAFAAVFDPGPQGDWEVFNRYNSDEHSRRYAELDDILGSGKHKGAWLVIYRVYPMEDR